MIKKRYFFYLIMIIVHVSHTATIAVDLQSKIMLQKIKSLANIDKIAIRVNQSMLPIPYRYLLTQPLMTKGVEEYYQRTPVIQTIYARKNKRNNTYSRSIIMLLDYNKVRNDVRLAQKKSEIMVVVLAFITINFNELPNKIIADVLNTNIPLGQLLFTNHVKILSTDRSYFYVRCNKVIFLLTHCNQDNKLYGRTHTLIRADNNRCDMGPHVWNKIKEK
ncbi:hypothetical protein TUM19329_09930 [Legionella antarctica]|uniref:Uncharacterized protein n=1 Tax=Legionella antarctica TaxID=2708020 RepID=A0A6F8T3N2_9GAMM|nr:hypothetical protein [Legionella antarctica]BCA94632.1 hypothetical protein TUM19329_09930 [Legionella antarctica]